MASGFEEIELCTCVDLLRRAEIEVNLLSIDDNIYLTGAHGITIKADALLKDVSDTLTDALIMPGGWPGAKNLSESEHVKQIINLFYKENKIIAAVCAAPMVLGTMGLLQGKKATCYPGFEAELFGAKHVSEPFVVDGNIITGKGPGCTADFCFAIIEKLKNKEVVIELKHATLFM